MCGIFGAINYNNFFHQENYLDFVKNTDLVSYRGPDSSGYITFNTKKQTINDKSNFNIFFGHRRLSIIDLSEKGNQPMSDGDELWIIYNGEIFNYLELRHELLKMGHHFNTNTDTEVILKIYREYGETKFDLLNGIWAFALLDLKRRKIILSRDRFSIKPLYFTENNQGIYFASEIKQLLPFLPAKEVNLDLMFAYLSQGLLDYNDQSFFRNIYKVKPMTNLVISLEEGTFTERKYWDYNFEHHSNRKEIEEKFRELLIDSIKIRLRSDVKIGALLSGGLDSSAISLIAHNLQKGNLETYSVVAKEQEFSEEKYVDIMSQDRGIKNRKLFYQHDEALNSLPQVIYHNEEPFGGFSVVAQYQILEKIRQETDITVVLTGQGGDEVLMGYAKYFFFNLKEQFRKGRLWEVFNQLVFSIINRTVLYQFNLSESKRYLPAYFPFLARQKPLGFLTIGNNLENIWNFQNIIERQLQDIDKYSIPALAHYEDRNSMAHSLETRLPFLDHRLVDFALGLPIEFKIKNGWMKYILRKSMPELPSAIRWRKDKQGFLVPEILWLKTFFRQTIQDNFKNSYLEEMGIINSKLFLNYYNQFINGNSLIYYADISRVLIAELWAQKFIKPSPD